MAADVHNASARAGFIDAMVMACAGEAPMSKFVSKASSKGNMSKARAAAKPKVEEAPAQVEQVAAEVI